MFILRHVMYLVHTGLAWYLPTPCGDLFHMVYMWGSYERHILRCVD